ncbi:hypothetical protein ACHWQZ_G018015 [Mnemiopsis leidyi]
MSRLQTPEASDPFYRVRSELRKVDPAARLRYSNQFAKDAHQRSHYVPRSHSCPEGIRVDDLGDFKLELVRRHNPHARRVCHIKGLNDVPVCVVRDELNAEWENRFIVSPGSLAPAYSKPKKKYTDKSSEFGFLTDRSRTSSRVSVPKMSLIPGDTVGYDNDLNDELDSIQALDILCSILQTNSLQTVQAWIEQATDEERTVVLKALRDMKEKGLLAKPSVAYQSNLAPLREDKVSVSYEKRWNQNKSLEDSGDSLLPEPAPVEVPKPPPVAKTPAVGTQTPVSVISQTKKRGERPPTRIQMSGLSRPSSQLSKLSPSGRPSTMKSVREKFVSFV